MSLGGRIRQLRRARGLTIERVARTCGLSPTHLRMVEIGERPPPAPVHPAYVGLGRELGEPPERLRRAARRERAYLIEGLPWHKWSRNRC